jgi:glycosyltransferase involved in cell wall biosynthesis
MATVSTVVPAAGPALGEGRRAAKSTSNTLSVVIPVYNEAGSIESVVRDVIDQLSERGLTFELLVLNDGSTDWTPDLEQRLSRHRAVHLHHFHPNEGKGAALNRAFPMLSSEITVVIDADGEYLASNIPDVIEPLLRNEADWVSGSRYGFGRPRPAQYWMTYGVNRLINLLFLLLSGVRFRDLLSGLYAFRTELADGLELREKRFSYTAELLCKLARRPGMRFLEVPIEYRFRTYSEGKKIRWWETGTIVWAMLRYRTIR